LTEEKLDFTRRLLALGNLAILMWIFLAFLKYFSTTGLMDKSNLLLLVSLCFTLFCAGWAVATATNARLVRSFLED
jgi:hypothetical protein